MRFVLGNVSACQFYRQGDTEPRALLTVERQRHGDFVDVPPSDCQKAAVAVKTLAWFRHAAKMTPVFRWIGKTDDDSLVHLPKLQADMLAMLAVARKHNRKPVRAYYGTLRWRLWLPPRALRNNPKMLKLCSSKSIGCACGTQSDAWLPDSKYTRSLMARDAQTDCVGAIGPFPYADGSLNVLSSRLAHEVLTRGGHVDDFAASKTWTHEDVGIAYLLLRQTCALGLPTMYFTLQNWIHNLRWYDARDTYDQVLKEHALSAHRVKNAMHAELVGDLFATHNRSRDGFACVPCANWGWNASAAVSTHQRLTAPAELLCCQKVPFANGMKDKRFQKMKQMKVRFAESRRR